MKSLFAVIAMLISSAAIEAVAADRYLCENEKGTGFRYSETFLRWNQKSFDDDAKFLLTKTGDDAYSLERTGTQDEYVCERVKNYNLDLAADTLWVKCETHDRLKSFMFNGASKRFVWQSIGDYLHQPIGANPSTSKADVLTFIGACSTL